jgi:uncharacterized protein involved in cysteine biosynthesis
VIRELTGGVGDGLRGAAYLARHRALWKWVIAPAVIAAVIAAVTIGWLVALLGVFGIIGWTAVAGGVIAFGMVIAGPFCEMLSEAIAEHVSGKASPSFSLGRFLYELAVGAAHAIRKVIGYGVLFVGLVFVGMLSPPLAAAGGAWVTARFASYDCYDSIFARRHWRYRQKTGYLGEHRWRPIGLGAVVGLVLVVPGLNIVALAAGSAGATLRVLGDEDASAATAR